MPFENDKWNATNTIIDKLINAGYCIVERKDICRILDEMKLQMSGITEYQAIKAGELLNADYIIAGNAYSQYKEYIPPSTNDEILSFIVQMSNQSKAGTYIYATWRFVRVRDGRVMKSGTSFIEKY